LNAKFEGVTSDIGSKRAPGTEKDVQIRNAAALGNNSGEQKLLMEAHVHGKRTWYSVRSQIPRWPDITEWMTRKIVEVNFMLDIDEGLNIDEGPEIDRGKDIEKGSEHEKNLEL
jgi:hypothetical protein